MKKFVILCFLLMCCCRFCIAQKVVGDCTVTYVVNAEDNSLDSDIIKNAYKKLYVGGGKSLTELSFNGFEQQTFYNANSNDVYILYNMNNQKYMRVLSKNEWTDQYKNYKGMHIEPLNETKNIIGYTCKKVLATLNDGAKINLYYTTDIKTNVGENPYMHDAINGLVLQYEAVFQNKYRITYTASKINFDPVPSEKFTVPKTGYRILNKQ